MGMNVRVNEIWSLGSDNQPKTNAAGENVVNAVISEIYGKTGTVQRRVMLFDNAPASVAISSGVVSFVAANLITLTFNASLGLTNYRITTKLVGTTTQIYAVYTINGDDNTDRVNKMSHSLTPDDSISGGIVMADKSIEEISEDVITSISFAVVASGTLPAADNGMIITVEAV